MIYRQRNKNKFKGLKIVVVIFTILLFFRLLNISFISKLLDQPVNYILESNAYVLRPLKNTVLYFKVKKDLQTEVDRLKLENTDLKLENLLNRNITQEFEYFKNQFGEILPENNVFKVILKPPFTPFDMIRITGDLEQYQSGNLVFYKNILIGKITEKDSRYATVELFSSPQKKTVITVKGTQFEAYGLGGGRYVFDASKEFEIEEGEAIVYPESTVLILGIVELVESKEEDLFKKVYFNLPTSLDMISYVTVGIIQKNEPETTDSN